MGAAAADGTGAMASSGGAAASDSEAVSGRLDDAGEVLHALQTLGQGLATEIEDQFADTEPAVAGDILDHLFGRAKERPPVEPG
jgi:hypothetical protein